MRAPSSLCILLGLLLVASIQADKLIRAPLEKINKKDLHPFGTITNFLATKPSLVMTNTFDHIFLSNLKVGEHEQGFNVIMDTGSSTFWIPYNSDGIKSKNKYDCSKSKFCKPQPHNVKPIRYGDGTMEGFVTTDRVKIGETPLDDFKFLLATKLDFKNHDDIDGILGLSPGLGEDGAPTVVQRLKDAGVIDKLQFSMYLGSVLYARGTATGEIIFGGYDPAYMRENQEFQFIKMTAKNSWTTNLAGVGMGNMLNVSDMAATPVAIDSGTSLIYLPDNYVINIVREIRRKGVKCTIDLKQNLYNCDCKARTILPDLVIYFDNLTLSIPPTSYVETIDNKCFLVVKAHEANNRGFPALLGDVFLKHYYTLYDQENLLIGFAIAAPVSHWKNWVLAICIFGSMALVYGLIHYILRDRKGGSSSGSSNNSSGGGLAAFFRRRTTGQGVTLGGSSNNRSRLLGDNN